MKNLTDTIKNIFPESGVRLYSKNLIWSFSAKFISLLISLLTISIVARILGPESFGTLNYAISFGTLIAVFLNLGIDSIIYRDITAEKDKRGEVLGTGMTLKFLAGVLTAIAISVTALISDETSEIKTAVIFFGLSYITQPLSLLFLNFLAERKTKFISIIQILTVIVISTLKIIVVFYFDSIALFILVQGSEALVSGGLSLFVLRRNFKEDTNFSFSKDRAKSLLAFILPLTLFSVFSEIYNKIDIVMLRHMQSTTTVGLYSAAIRLTEVWFLISNIIVTTVFPALSNSFNENKNTEYIKRLRTLSLLLLILAVIIILGIFIFGKTLVYLIYGKEFIGAYPILLIYILSLPGAFALSILYQDFILKNKLWYIAFIAFVPAIINVLLNLILIPGHAAAGAAGATVASYSIIAIFLCFNLIKTKE